jgi:hypothetical protein
LIEFSARLTGRRAIRPVDGGIALRRSFHPAGAIAATEDQGQPGGFEPQYQVETSSMGTRTRICFPRGGHEHDVEFDSARRRKSRIPPFGRNDPATIEVSDWIFTRPGRCSDTGGAA